MNRTLFITWDGPAQNYMQALFFPTFARAQAHDLTIEILQFTWADAAHIANTAKSAASHDLRYTHAPTLRRPRQLAVPTMIALGARRIIQEIDTRSIDTLMPRSIIPAAMCLLARRWRPDVRLVFDADGFMADERVDFAGWNPQGAMYRLFRDWEAQAVRSADAVITRSMRARTILQARAGAGAPANHIHVIPNAKDDALFSPGTPDGRIAVRAALDIPDDAPLLAYAGSLGPQYHPEAMLELFELVLAHRPDAHLMVMSGMREVFEALLMNRPESLQRRVILTRCPPEQVARHLAAADLGLSLRAPSFSQQGVCPIKVVEYMLCGLPTVMIRGVGDLDERFKDARGLHVLEDVTHTSLSTCADWFVNEALEEREMVGSTLREVGLREFGMDRASKKLHELLTAK